MIFNSYSECQESLAGIRLVSCGHVFAEPQREIYRPHGREDWLLFYVAKESETFFFDQPTVAEAGSFILFAPGEKQHHMYKGSKTAEFYYVHFRCDALPDAIALKTSRIYTLPLHQQTASVFEDMIEDTLEKRPHYELTGISRLLYLLCFIRREATSISTSYTKEQHSVARAVRHMRRHCESNMTLDEYAAMCHMSKYHFLRTFKEATGTTPMEYRARIRIEHAKELLQNSYYSVCEIAQALGYTSLSYFSAAFKRATGIAPSAYPLRHLGTDPAHGQ